MTRLPTPHRRLTTPRLRKATTFKTRTVDVAAAGLDTFTAERLADLFARGEHSPRPDGFPTSSRSSIRSSEPSSSTERAALTIVEAQEQRRDFSDPLGKNVDELKANLREIARLTKRCQWLAGVIENAGEVVKDVQDPDRCQACDVEVAGTREDRLRSGYCKAHYEAWRALPPDQRDRVRFEASVRSRLAEEAA